MVDPESGIIPGAGDVADAALNYYLVVRKARQAEYVFSLRPPSVSIHTLIGYPTGSWGECS